jgi:hypothetical protein
MAISETVAALMNRWKRWLGIVGAGLVLLTFVVKEGLRENLKDFIDTLDSAENVHLIRGDVTDVMAQLWAIRMQTARDIKSHDRAMNNLIASSAVSSLEKLDGLIDLFSTKEREQYKLRTKNLIEKINAANEEVTAATDNNADGVLDNRLVPAAQALASAADEADAVETEILQRARNMKEHKRMYYITCTYASYGTYFLGWFLGFCATLAGMNSPFGQ